MVATGLTAYSPEELESGTGFDRKAIEQGLEKLIAGGVLRQFKGNNIYVLNSVFDQKAAELIKTLEKYHHQYPLRPGISKEEIRSRSFSDMNNKLFNALLEVYRVEGIIEIIGENIAKQGFEAEPRAEQIQLFKKIEEDYRSSDYQTPGWEEIKAKYRLDPADSEEILNYFINRRFLVKLDDNVLIHRENLEQAKDLLIGFLREKNEISLGEARDLLKTSRKYALPVMSFFDKEKITRRIDDKRVLY